MPGRRKKCGRFLHKASLCVITSLCRTHNPPGGASGLCRRAARLLIKASSSFLRRVLAAPRRFRFAVRSCFGLLGVRVGARYKERGGPTGSCWFLLLLLERGSGGVGGGASARWSLIVTRFYFFNYPRRQSGGSWRVEGTFIHHLVQRWSQGVTSGGPSP